MCQGSIYHLINTYAHTGFLLLLLLFVFFLLLLLCVEEVVAMQLQCVALCCSVLQCVAVCCSVLQSVDVCCSLLQMQQVATVLAHVSSDTIHCLPLRVAGKPFCLLLLMQLHFLLHLLM